MFENRIFFLRPPERSRQLCFFIISEIAFLYQMPCVCLKPHGILLLKSPGKPGHFPEQHLQERASQENWHNCHQINVGQTWNLITLILSFMYVLWDMYSYIANPFAHHSGKQVRLLVHMLYLEEKSQTCIIGDKQILWLKDKHFQVQKATLSKASRQMPTLYLRFCMYCLNSLNSLILKVENTSWLWY